MSAHKPIELSLPMAVHVNANTQTQYIKKHIHGYEQADMTDMQT